MRSLLLALLAALALAGEALTPEQQRQHEAWLEAMRQSQAAGKPGTAPPAARPIDPKSTPEYQASEQANRDAEAARLRDEQARQKAEREAREKAAVEARERQEAEEAARWAEIRARQEQEAQAERDARAAEDRRREAAAQQERAAQERRERWHTVGLVTVGVLGLIALVLPSVIASFRDSPQRPAIAGLVVCSLLSALAAGQQPSLSPAPVLLWSAALALSLWRFKFP